MTNLALKYRPKSFEDVVEQDDVVKILESMCEQPELHNRNFLLVGPRGCGKANPMHTNILTPSGFKKMRDVEVGDKVFTHSGRVATVSGVYPQGIRPIYRITLSDRTHIDVSDEHLNMITLVNHMSDNTKYEDKVIKTTNLFDIYENRDKFESFTFCVKSPRVNFDICNVFCLPYTFGTLIRNGGFDDTEIPKEYLFNTFYYRVDLLKALLYTDYLDNKRLSSSNILQGKMTLFCNGEALSSSISFLVRSLGIVDTVYDYSHYISNLDIDADTVRRGQFEFAHVLQIPQDIVSRIFEPDKILDEDNYPLLREITSVEYIGEEDCQCIMVDDPDHSYICDEGLIPTHNTTLGRIMANKLNDGLGSPIELDAASNSGVDTVRNIISQAREYPIGTKYKVFICDECFPPNTLIDIPGGKKPICEINAGDNICNLTGTAKVSQVFKNCVKTSNLRAIILSDNIKVITTANHLVFTQDGWVSVDELVQGDLIYDNEKLRSMRKTISSEISQRSKNLLLSRMPQASYSGETVWPENTISKSLSNMWEDFLGISVCECNNMWEQVRSCVERTAQKYGEISRITCSTLAYIYLSCMREADGNSKFGSSDSMQSEMCNAATESRENVCQESFQKTLRSVWLFIQSALEQSISKDLQRKMSIYIGSENSVRSEISRIFNSDAYEQSDERSGKYRENEINQIKERNFAQAACFSWWKWAINESSDSFERSFEGSMGIRISCENGSNNKQQPKSICYELQARPSLSGVKNRSRGGWCRPQREVATVLGCQENSMLKPARVDRVEVFKLGHNEQYFTSSFTNTELHHKYVVMYDLEIAGHPSYFANNILVHNCHAFSQAAWSSLLKTLEEQPARSVFVLLTTNPEKIPQTILSRVQKFRLSTISLDGIVSRLKYVIEQENKEGRNITYEDEALTYIAKLAKGGMRDSLTLLDKALVYRSEITSSNIKVSLGIPDYQDYFDLLNAYAKKDNLKTIEVIQKVYNSGTNFVKWFEEFQSFVINIVKYVYLQDISETMIPPYYKDKISHYGPKHVQLCLHLSQVLVELISKISRTEYMEEVAISYLMRK